MSKNVIITGTSSGIGFELVKLFSEKNNNILAISRDNNNLRMLDLPGVTSIDLDLTESEDLGLLVGSIIASICSNVTSISSWLD